MSEGAPYRAIKVTLWHDEKFFTLSDDGQLVWLHLYTNPMTTGLGMYHASIEGLSASKRWPLERYRKGFGEGLAKGLFEYDETFQVVYFPRFIRHNKPSNPNVLVSLMKAWEMIPPTPLKHRLYADLKGLGEPFAEKLERLGVTLPQTYTETVTVTVTGTGTVSDYPAEEGISTELDKYSVGGSSDSWGVAQ